MVCTKQAEIYFFIYILKINIIYGRMNNVRLIFKGMLISGFQGTMKGWDGRGDYG